MVVGGCLAFLLIADIGPVPSKQDQVALAFRVVILQMALSVRTAYQASQRTSSR